MIASRRLINLAGTLLVVIALAVGTMLTAVPIHLESDVLNAQKRDVASSNQLLQTQIGGLHAKEAELPQLEQELGDLHQQLPGTPHLDDVSQLVVKAADKAGAHILSIEFSDYEAFVARDLATVIERLPKTATNVARSEPEDKSDTTDKVASQDKDANQEKNETSTAEPVSTKKPADPATASQLQFPVTIKILTTEQSSAIRFLDELRVGPRLLQIDDVTAKTDDKGLELTVKGLVFVSRSN